MSRGHILQAFCRSGRELCYPKGNGEPQGAFTVAAEIQMYFGDTLEGELVGSVSGWRRGVLGRTPGILSGEWQRQSPRWGPEWPGGHTELSVKCL